MLSTPLHTSSQNYLTGLIIRLYSLVATAGVDGVRTAVVALTHSVSQANPVICMLENIGYKHIWFEMDVLADLHKC